MDVHVDRIEGFGIRGLVFDLSIFVMRCCQDMSCWRYQDNLGIVFIYIHCAKG